MSTATLSIHRVGAVGDMLTRHINQVVAVREYCAPPPEWDQLVGRLHAFRAPTASSPLRDRLIDAILHGGADEAAQIAELRALAEAEAQPPNQVLMTVVTGAVGVALFDLYDPVADNVYACVAKAFNDTAAKFTAAAAKVDVELGSEEVVGQPGPARTAWINAVALAGALDGHLVALAAAAELAGQPVDSDELLIPLVIANLEGLHRRRLWEAFLSAHPPASGKPWVSRRELAREPSAPRCGRWAALIAVGAQLAAADLSLGELAPYGRPGPLDRRERRVAGQVGNTVWHFDPCDPDYVEQLAAAGFSPREGVGYATAAS